MKRIVLAGIAALIWAASSAPVGAASSRIVDLHYRMYVGSASKPIASGSVWLFRYGWSGFIQAAVGNIRDGAVHVRFDDTAMLPLKNDDPRYDSHYVAAIELPGNIWYEGSSMTGPALFAKFGNSIEAIGSVQSRNGQIVTLVLPPVSDRTLTLAGRDGNAFASQRISLLVHVSTRNHCGAEEGPRLFDAITDARGTIHFRFPPTPVEVQAEYREGSPGSQIGNYWSDVGRAPDVTLRKDWGLSRAAWTITVVDRSGKPMRGVLVDSYSYVACGVFDQAVTDGHGTAIVRVIPSVDTSVNIKIPNGVSQQLSPKQLDLLRRTGGLTIVG